MFNIQVLDNISPQGLKLLADPAFKVGSEFNDPDVLLVRSSKLHDHTFGSHLKAVARAGAGTDNIPVAKLTQLGIPVFYAPGANANAVKELVMAAMLMGYRHLSNTRAFISDLTKQDNQTLNQQIESQKKQFVGHEISGKTLGVIGLGNVGVKVANAALGLGMSVIGYDSNMTLNNALALMPAVEKVLDLNTLLAHSDIITLHVPLTEETTYLINNKNIDLLKPNTLLLNFSREKIVNEEAIIQGLDDKKMMTYITDFPTVHLANHPNVLCFPHLGASTLEAEQSSAEMVIRNLCNYLKYGIIEYAVNFPNISLSTSHKAACHRILVVNHNRPGIVSNMTQKISQLGYNIEQMENKSRDDLAVNLIDFTGPEQNLSQIDKNLLSVTGLIRASLVF